MKLNRKKAIGYFVFFPFFMRVKYIKKPFLSDLSKKQLVQAENVDRTDFYVAIKVISGTINQSKTPLNFVTPPNFVCHVAKQ